MADDYTPEERAALRQRALAALADADENKQLLRERQMANAQAAALGEARAMASQQRGTSPAPQRTLERPEPGADYWQKWDAWARSIADRQVNAALCKFAEDIGEEIGKSQKREREAMRAELKAAVGALEDRMTANETAAVGLITEQESRIAALEARLAEAEKRVAPAARSLVRVA